MKSSLFIPKNIHTRGEMGSFEKMLRKLCCVTLFFVLPIFSFSQSCPTNAKNPWEWPSQSNWLIGNGLKGKFSGGSLTITPQPNVTTYEGTSGASDDWGNLLFLNNGRSIWDAQGNLKFSGLLEGNEGGGASNGSASQGVITVRHPLDTLNYYIFTVDDALTTSAKGLNYFVVDRNGNLKSGPIRLGTYRTTEGIAATTHANGVDIWVTAYASSGSTNFYTYLITCSGVVKTPVISSVAPPITDQNNERGGLAFSWDSKLFAQGRPESYPNGDKEVSVYKFDNQTGIISDPHHISDPGTLDGPYDITFSPDNSKLYFSTVFGTLGYYDVSSWNTATMAASLKYVKGANVNQHGAIEIGGDGNLYFGNFLGQLGKLTGNLNTGAVTFSNIPGTYMGRGLPTMYLPPLEEPDIQEVGPFCTTDPPVDLSTKWICKGIDAEDPINNPDAYSGDGIIDKGKGIFDPAKAKAGKHEIIFKRCSVDDTIYIIVNPCACPDTTLKPMPPICADGSLDLDAYKITTEAGTWSIISTPPASTATLSGTVFHANNTVAGKYTVRYTLTNKVAGCADFAERVIIVNPLPVVTAATGVITCYGQSTTCTANGATNYTWSNGDVGQSITVTPLVATSYTVTGVDVNGCKDTAMVTVTVPDKLELTTIVTNVNCTGKDNGTATVIATGGTPGYAYLWSNGQSTAAITALAMGTYTVIVTDSKLCMSTVSITIGAPILPTADFSFSTACYGNAVVFTDHSNPGNGNTITTYKWNFGDPASGASNIDDSNSPLPHIYNAMTTYTVKLLIVTNNGCQDSTTKQVDVWPVPKADFGSPVSGCKPVCATFKDLSTITGGVISKWTWSFGDPGSGASNTSNSQAPETHCYQNPGFYSVTLTVESNKGCKNAITKKDIVNVLNSPKAAFTSDVQEAQIFSPNFHFYDQSTGTPTSWHWDFGVTSLLNDTSVILNPKWTYTDTGKYNVCLTVKNAIGCSDYICHPVIVTPYWTFYIPNAFTPNADGDNDFFNGKGYNLTEYQLWIFDRWGNMIYTTGKANGTDSSVPWNGKANNGQEPAQQDVYIWKVELKDIFNKPHSYIGTVTLVK
jgi:gliding motility-associated-like protein